MASRIRPLIQYMRDSKAWIGYFALATGASAMVKGALVDLHAVPGQSMAPTLSPAFNETGTYDHIITIKRNLRGKPSNPEFQSSIEFLRPARSTIKRGDLVTFWKPHNPEILGVKRVIGLEGDTIIRNVKRVGKQSNEAGKESEKMGMAVPPPVVKVPPGHIWVEGDNWRHTVDSNDYGTVRLVWMAFASAVVTDKQLMNMVDSCLVGYGESSRHLLAAKSHGLNTRITFQRRR
jgi:inner membrane protease subunit 2